MEMFEFSQLTECEDALLDVVCSKINENLTQQKQVAIALAGGNTPKGLYQKLSHADIDWSRMAVTLTDERWLDTHSEDSNENMLKQSLFQHHAKMALFLGLKNVESTPEIGQIRTDHLLKQNIPVLDYVILGMGDDGHFASIFPNMSNTEQLLDTQRSEACLPAYPSGKPARISLTLAYLLSAKHIFLFISGLAKRDVIQQGQSGARTAALPIDALLNQTQCPVSIYWSAA